MKSFLFLTFFLFFSFFVNAQVGIGTTNPDASSMLDISSTNSGLLIPRVALTATNAAGPITAPVTSLLVYNTATAGVSPNNVVPGYYYWNGAWIALTGAGGSGWNLSGNAGTTAGTNFIGTTDGNDLRIKTGGTDRLNISNTNGQLQSYTTTGSATTPSYSFSGTQTSTGMFNPAAANLGFSSGGTERFRIPNANQVHAMSLGTAALPFYSFSGQTTTGMFGVATDVLGFATAGTEKVRIEADGDVGIGATPNATAKLQINATDRGLLIPNVALLATNNGTLPIASPATSLLVYNTATAGVSPNNVVPGYYYWNGVWVPLATGTVTNDWSILGNTNIVDGTNFIGTGASTNVDVAFKRNNAAAGKIGATSTSFGVGALTAGAASNSTAFGTNALVLTTGNDNVALGNGALSANTTGTGSTAIGTNALAKNTATGNTALGYNALTNNVATVGNTAVGYTALAANTAANNTAVGYTALAINTGADNTALGFQALKVNVAGTGSTAVGSNALALNTATGNTAVGFGALTTNSIGTGNSALGTNALRLNSTGTNNTAIGTTAVPASPNASALGANSTGINNTAVGAGALALNTVTSNNTAIGSQALAANFNAFPGAADSNTAIGSSALFGNTTGRFNVALGASALLANTTGASNVAVGYNAGSNITIGASSNIMIGANTVAPSAIGFSQLNIGNTIYGNMAGALTSRTIGINVVSPQGALDITSTDNGLLIPRVALTDTATVTVLTGTASEIVYNTATNLDVTPGFYYLSTNAGPWVRFNTGSATGWQTNGNTVGAAATFMGTIDNYDVSFKRFNTAAGFIGATNNAFGVGALAANAAGTRNTALGTSALLVSDTPNDNTALGYQALKANTGSNGNTGNQNTAVGSGALAALNGGLGNTAVGASALTAAAGLALYNTAVGALALTGVNTAASRDNVAVGYSALSAGTGTITDSVALGSGALTSAANGSTRNTAIGKSAGSNLTTGTDNIVIGANAQTTAATSTNQIIIGAGAPAFAYVNAASWSYSSDRRLKSDIKDSPLGLDFIKTIRPVSYFRKDDVDKKTEFGFIAQELETALSKAGVNNSGILSHTANGMFAVRYNDFLPMTVKAVQEQQEEIEALKKANAELMKTNAAILKRLEALEKK